MAVRVEGRAGVTKGVEGKRTVRGKLVFEAHVEGSVVRGGECLAKLAGYVLRMAVFVSEGVFDLLFERVNIPSRRVVGR